MKQIINQAFKDYTIKNYPSYPERLIHAVEWTDKTANGLTSIVIKFLEWKGEQAERISTTGRPINNTKKYENAVGQTVQVGSIEWIKGTGKKGSADISATIKKSIHGIEEGLSVKFEVKMKDKQSKAQKDYERQVKQAGGRYYIIHSFEEFYNIYTEIKKPIEL